MYNASDILITFIIQYFMFPEIQPNRWNYAGASLITLAMILIMYFKLIDAKRQKQLEQDERLGLSAEKPGCFKRFIFFKV